MGLWIIFRHEKKNELIQIIFLLFGRPFTIGSKSTITIILSFLPSLPLLCHDSWVSLIMRHLAWRCYTIDCLRGEVSMLVWQKRNEKLSMSCWCTHCEECHLIHYKLNTLEILRLKYINKWCSGKALCNCKVVGWSQSS